MKYVRRFEDGRCCKLVIGSDCVILSMFPAGVFECHEPFRFSSLPSLLERLASAATIHPDLQDFVERVWFRHNTKAIKAELSDLPLGTDRTVNGVLYRLNRGDVWRPKESTEFSISTATMAERLAAEELTALLKDTLDYEELD